MENNQKIKCQVESCKFQNSDYCMLKEILVGYSYNANNVTTNNETLCKSFECDQEKTETK